MSLGLKRAGFELIRAYDSWLPAVRTYEENVGDHVAQADLKDIFQFGPLIANLQPDLIAGGPPCQDFSLAGGKVEGERASLTKAFGMLVAIARPEWFLMENVPQAARSKAWAETRAMLKKVGYGLTECKLDASFYGVPQTRKRLFVVGRIGESDGFLDSALSDARALTQKVLGDLFDVPEGFVYSRPFRAGRGVRSLSEPFPTVTRTAWERPLARYLSNPNPQDPVPATMAHVLSREELSQIQGFPASWRWNFGTRQDVYQMIANAVPAPQAEAIGRVILARQAGDTIPQIQGQFSQWLRHSKGFSNGTDRNIRSRVNRARRLLLGRTFVDLAVEVAELEAVGAFRELPSGTKTDLRKALRLYAEWRALAAVKKVRVRSARDAFLMAA